MGNEHWAETDIKTVFFTASGGTPSTAKSEFWDNGDVPWINSGTLKDNIISQPSHYITKLGLEQSSAKMFPKYSVVIALTGATTGKVGLLDFNCSTNQSVTGIFPSEYYDYKLLFNYLISIREKILSQCLGSAQPHINKEIVDNVTIPLPPLGEQKRIVKKLDAILPKVKNIKSRLEKIPLILKRFRQSILASASSGKLTEDWREENNIPAPVEMTLGEILKVSSGDFLTSIQMAKDGSIPVYGGNGITGYHDKGNVSEPTLVIGRVGYYCGSVHLTPKIAWITDNALIVKHDLKQTSKHFLYYALQSLNLRVNDSATAQPVISGQKIYPIDICIPDIREQQEIVIRVEKLFKLADSLEAKYKKAMERIEKIEQSVLAKAFRGELVEPDPNDESAEELLKRILAEKSKLEIEKKKSKRLHKGHGNKLR